MNTNTYEANIVNLAVQNKRKLEAWNFFLPSQKLIQETVRINNLLGELYDGKWRAGIAKNIIEANKITGVLATEVCAAYSIQELHNEEVIFFQIDIAERMYRECAMLARSLHAKENGTFDILEDLCKDMAEDMGLGAVSLAGTTVQQQSQKVLQQLAAEFYTWLDNNRGVYQADWGIIALTTAKLTIGQVVQQKASFTPYINQST